MSKTNTCEVDDCDRGGKLIRGLCNMHYRRMMRLGSLELPPPPTCKADNCKDRVHSNGYCRPHHSKWRRYGDPLETRRYNNAEDSFQARTTWRGDCLVWTASKTKGGYGKLTVEGKLRGAHQYAWERENGPIPAGMEIDHTCFNRPCCNIKHLRLATEKQNRENLRQANPNNHSSGIRGVCWNKTTKSWMAKATHNGKQFYNGHHATIAEAEAAVIELRNRLFTHNLTDRQAA
jgi:hypothetical protein